MEDKNLKYNEVLSILKKTEPVLYDAEGLTDRIMQRVKQIDSGAERIRMMHISGILSGVAASALICLLTYETLKYPASSLENYSMSKQSYMSYDLAVLHGIREKEKIIETVVKNKEAQRVQKEKLMAAFIVYYETSK